MQRALADICQNHTGELPLNHGQNLHSPAVSIGTTNISDICLGCHVQQCDFTTTALFSKSPWSGCVTPCPQSVWTLGSPQAGCCVSSTWHSCTTVVFRCLINERGSLVSAFWSSLLNLATGIHPNFHYRCQNASSVTCCTFSCAFPYLQNGALMLVPFTVVLHVVIHVVFHQKFQVFVTFVSQKPALM